VPLHLPLIIRLVACFTASVNAATNAISISSVHLTLTLLMTFVAAADNAHNTVAANNFAVSAHFSD